MENHHSLEAQSKSLMDSIQPHETSESYFVKLLSTFSVDSMLGDERSKSMQLDETSKTYSPQALSTFRYDSMILEERLESMLLDGTSNSHSLEAMPFPLDSMPPGEWSESVQPKRKMADCPIDCMLLGPSVASPINVPHATSPKDSTLRDKIESEIPIMVDINIYKGEISMLAELNEAVLEGEEHKISQIACGIYNPKMGLKPVVAHIAARLGHHPTLKCLLNQFRSLSKLPNGRGDTPLHVAARAGQLEIVKYFSDPNSGDVESGDGKAQQNYLSKKNIKGNTALHEALENNQENVAWVLVTVNPELLYLPNNEGKTPEYLAVGAGFLKLLEYMWGLEIQHLRGDDFNLSQCKVMTPPHAAIIRRHTESLQFVLKHKPKLTCVTDKKGRSPLHYAASMGYYDGLKELLNIDTQVAYQPDRLGHYPIHEAASAGHSDVIKLLLDFCPGSWALLGKGGQNVHHIAAQTGKENVVRYILKMPMFEMLINDLDVSENTPLHMAIMCNHYKVARVLTRDRRVNMSISNNDNLTALDVAEKSIATGGSLGKLQTLTTLRIANAPRAQDLDVLDDKDRLNYLIHRPKAKDFKDRVNTLLLVSTLVTTVTFAAGFTIPGGLNSKRIAVLLTNTKFKAFVICDAIALFCSILAVVSLLWAQLGDVSLIRSVIGFTLLLLGISLSMMVIAFSAGLYLVTSQLHWLAHTVLIMGTIFLICTLIVLLPLRMPLLTKYHIFQRISYYFFYLLASTTGDDSDDDYDIRKGYVEKKT
ncbi:hypothetical protein NE237_021231 [Protea cynaroides]|uniref:PGG domain-containing protein n=1 Tax=Protea cynaroides TaxID=273540 RepID=A0A9Q0K332_9MAGN|nr:hypothetical protein NE237_021231 [Protea cynaroides]